MISADSTKMATKVTDGVEGGVDVKHIVEKGYDKIAPAYLDWAKTKTASRIEAINKLVALLPDSRDTKVLELGCGAGVPATQILAKHFTVIGNDMLVSLEI